MSADTPKKRALRAPRQPRPHGTVAAPLRIATELREQIAALAEAEHRSLNAQMITLLEEALAARAKRRR